MRIKWQGKRNLRLKLIISAIFMLVGAAIASWALGYGQNNNSDGLVLDIDFSADNYDSATRTFKDKSGNNNNAISTNAAAFAPDKDGKSNGAMRFTTTNDEVVIGHSSSYKTPSITVSFWYRPEDVSKRHVIFTSWLGFTTEIQSGQFKWGLNGPSGQYYGSSNVTWNDWTYFTGTFDDATKQQCIYFNGIKKQCQIVSGSISYNTSGLFISGPWDWIKGDFGNVKIYNRSLSEQEVKQLYNDTKPKAQISSLEKGLIGHWPLNGENYDSTSNRVTDKSGYTRHGTGSGVTVSEGPFGQNSAFDFGTINDGFAVNIPSKNFAGLADFTMSAWVYPKGDHLHYDGTILSSGDWNTNHWAFSLNQTNSGIKTRRPNITVNYNFLDNKWYHVIYSRKGTTVKFFINGENVYTAENVNNIPLDSGYSNTKIGMDTYTGNYFNFNGKIADVRMYDRALSDGEVGLLYGYTAPSGVAGDSLQKGLILDVPLTSKYTKGGSSGSEIVADLSPFSRNGQCVNTTLSADGAIFNGVNSYITFGTGNTFFPLSKFTVSLWFKSTGTVPSTGTAPGLFGFTYGLRANISSNGTIQFGVDDGSAFRYLFASGKDYRDSQWHHFVGMNDGSNSYLYIDGAFVGQAAYNWSGTTRWPTDNFRIGRDNNDVMYHFLGNLRSLKIYNRPLTAQEVKTLYDRGRGNSGAVLNGL